MPSTPAPEPATEPHCARQDQAGDAGAAVATGSSDTDVFTCHVCLDEDLPRARHLTRLPCCGRTGTNNMCTGCCETLIPAAPGVGRCPFCREHIHRRHIAGGTEDAVPTEAAAGFVVARVDGAGTCIVCNQPRVLVAPHPRARPEFRDQPLLCHRCDLGTRLPHLRYRCVECHGIQGIPHPMFLYQARPDAPSDDTWACHRCQDQRRWRLLAEDIPRVPPAELPEGWGARGAVLEEARRLVAASRVGRPDHFVLPARGGAVAAAAVPEAPAARPVPAGAEGSWAALLSAGLHTVWRKAPVIAVGVAIVMAAANELGWLKKP